MNRFKMNLYILAVLLVTAFYLPGSEILKYDEFIKIIETKLPEIKQYENKIKKQANNSENAYAVFDPTVKLSVYGQGYQAYPDNENMISHYSPGFGSDFSINTILPSGTRLSSGFTYSQKYTSGENTTTSMRGDEITSDWSKVSYDPVLKFGITQPVLNNWFGFLDRWSLKNEKNKLRIEDLRQELNIENLTREYKKLYYNWISITEKLTLIDKSLANARKQMEQTEKKVRLGLLENDSLESVQYSLLKYQNQKQGYLKDYQYLQNQLATFIELEKYQPDLEYFNRLYANTLSGKSDYIEFHNTRNSRILNLTRENYEYLKKARINKTMPSLNLFANLDINFHYAVENANDEETIFSFSDNDAKNVNFKSGLEFSMPLGNISARKAVKETEIMINDVMAEYEKTRITHDKNLKNIITFTEYLKSSIDLNEESIKSLTNKYKTLQDKYKKGIVGLQQLIDTDNSITAEKMTRIDLKVNLINNRIDYEYMIK